MRKLLCAVAWGFAGSLSYGAPSNILTMQTGVRPAGMGNAFVAVSDDINALYSNPAGLGLLKDLELNAMMQQGLEGIDQNNFALIMPLGEVASQNVRSFGSFGLAFGELDY